MSFNVRIQHEDFDVGQEYLDLIANDKSAGAVVFFVGRVRDFSGGKNISSLSLEHYPGMTEKILLQILDEAKNRWQLVSAHIVHRIGDLQLGDQIVFVGVASAHREHAFHAGEYLMDFLKTSAPFWKKEFNQEGVANWVEAKDKDNNAVHRWNEAGR